MKRPASATVVGHPVELGHVAAFGDIQPHLDVTGICPSGVLMNTEARGADSP